MRKLFESRVGQVTDKEFIRVLDAVTADVKFNRIFFKSRTKLNDLLGIMETTLKVIRR